MRIRSLTVKREFYRDRYNQNKVWEVARLAGGYYLRQYVKGQQFGTGLRTSRKFIETDVTLDVTMIDEVSADMIIQYALFGEIVYG